MKINPVAVNATCRFSAIFDEVVVFIRYVLLFDVRWKRLFTGIRRLELHEFARIKLTESSLIKL
jgi:hypothetical protein